MKKFKLPSPHLKTQQGSAIIEFLITAVPILLLGLGATETARWYIHKQHIRYALVEAQRVATVTHAKPEQIVEAFEYALKPLFSPVGQYTSIEARREAYLQQVTQKTAMTPWRISITSPTPEHFKDFSQSNLVIANTTGLATINNNYQFEQHQEKGLGLHSQESIYEANILSLNLVYPYKPLVPGVTSLMKVLSPSSSSRLKQTYFEAGYLPLELTAHMAMQSHPVLWPTQPSGKVIKQEQIAQSDAAVSSMIESTNADLNCAGLWCSDSNYINGLSNSNHNTDNTEQVPYQPPQAPHQADTSNPLNPSRPWNQDGSNTTHIDDPLCGTSLCCV